MIDRQTWRGWSEMGYCWPLIETTVGKLLADFEYALREECLVDRSSDTEYWKAVSKTLECRDKLTAEIMRLLVDRLLLHPNSPKPVWFQPELRRLGISETGL